MAMSITLSEYLKDRHIPFDVLEHKATNTAMTTADVSHIPGESLAKGVLMRDPKGFLLAVIPAAHVLEPELLEIQVGGPVEMAHEGDMRTIFEDCDLGAIPALGEPFGLRTVWDDSLADAGEVYIEGGDHRTLVQIGHDDFMKMLADKEHGVFSHHM